MRLSIPGNMVDIRDKDSSSRTIHAESKINTLGSGGNTAWFKEDNLTSVFLTVNAIVTPAACWKARTLGDIPDIGKIPANGYKRFMEIKATLC
ncbi:hypothetical protein E4T56_gene1687 [Termitomyces sp. T112]|nr:hypothetical protein E4T56_gene1687 [Termitomyces sp. T112]